MTSPENRRQPAQPSDRRMGGRRSQRSDRRMEPPSGQVSKRKRNMAIFVGIALLGIIGGILGYGFYREFVAPTKVLAARVGDTKYTQGDLVKRLRLLQTMAENAGGRTDFSRAPFDVLIEMANAEIVRRFAPEHSLRVTDADIDALLFERFSPFIPEGQEVRPGQIESEYRENYRSFLESTHLSEKDYRQLVTEDVYNAKMRERLGQEVPSIARQVEVRWIHLPSELDNPPPGIGDGGPIGPSVDEVRKRLDTEDFEDVFKSVPAVRRFNDEQGYVGWIPKGAFLTLDDVLFGNEEKNIEPLALNEISDPQVGLEGSFIVQLIGEPEERQVSEAMRERLKTVRFENWLTDKKEIGGKEGWMEFNFSSELYAWVIEQVGQTTRATPVPAGRG